MGGRASGPLPFGAIGGVKAGSGRVEPCSSSRRLETACGGVLTALYVPKTVPHGRSGVRIISAIVDVANVGVICINCTPEHCGVLVLGLPPTVSGREYVCTRER